jgi:hypothetical protein
MEPRALDEGKRYKVGVIGNKTSLMPFWELFVSQGSGRVLTELGLVAAALPGDGVEGDPFGPGMNLPIYPDYQAMLASHPEINLVLESTGDQDHPWRPCAAICPPRWPWWSATRPGSSCAC